jgi:hypothetical protein
MTFTVEEANHCLRSGHYRGTFQTIEAAREYVAQQAKRTRKFMEYRICQGTPRNPGAYVEGEAPVKGEA